MELCPIMASIRRFSPNTSAGRDCGPLMSGAWPSSSAVSPTCSDQLRRRPRNRHLPHRGRVKFSAAIGCPVAFEVDGSDPPGSPAWSVVVKGTAEVVTEREFLDSAELPLRPWLAGRKSHFVRIVPAQVSGRSFTIADPSIWRTRLTGVRASPSD